MEATSTIPLVAFLGDPVGLGLAKGLRASGTNLTGVTTNAGDEIFGKDLEILRAISPKTSRVAWLAPRALWDQSETKALQDAAQAMGFSVLGPPLESPISEDEYARVIRLFVEAGADSILVSDAAVNFQYREAIVRLVNASKLPAVHAFAEFGRVGGLVAYGSNLNEHMRAAAEQVDRVLKGAKPGELPFIRPSRWQLIINLKTARELGLAIPESLLAGADEVIE
jgi:putative tryptophan/tyrosine transport system substrate-binding protein